MSEFKGTKGQWAVIGYQSAFLDSWKRFGHAQINKVTAKLVSVSASRVYGKQFPHDAVIAVFDDEETAAKMSQAIGGVVGEFDRRKRTADRIRSEALKAATEAAEKQVAALVAKALQS